MCGSGGSGVVVIAVTVVLKRYQWLPYQYWQFPVCRTALSVLAVVILVAAMEALLVLQMVLVELVMILGVVGVMALAVVVIVIVEVVDVRTAQQHSEAINEFSCLTQ